MCGLYAGAGYSNLITDWVMCGLCSGAVYNNCIANIIICCIFVVEFAHECIKHILSLYEAASDKPPQSVLLVGHSMVCLKGDDIGR